MFFSLNLCTLRELSLGFGTIKASSWRCNGQLPGVSPVFDRTETLLGEIVFPTRQASKAVSGSASPPRARSRVRYHQGIFLALQRSNTGGLPSIRSYRKLFWGKSFPHSPGSQSCLWERLPPESTLSGSVPSRHLLGAVAVYYRGLPSVRSYRNYSGGNLFPTRQAPRAVSERASPPRARSRVRYHQGIFLALQRSTTGGLPNVRSYRKLFWGNSFPHSPGSQSCLWERLPPREHALGFGTITASSWRCIGLLRRSPQYSVVQKLLWGKSFPHSPGSQSCLWERFPPESTLSGSVPSRKASSWRCSGLIPGVSPVFDRTENYSERNIFPTRQAPRAVSGSASPPRARSRVRYHHGIFLAL